MGTKRDIRNTRKKIKNLGSPNKWRLAYKYKSKKGRR